MTSHRVKCGRKSRRVVARDKNASDNSSSPKSLGDGDNKCSEDVKRKEKKKKNNPSLTLLHQQDGHPDQHSPIQRVLHVCWCVELVWRSVSSQGKKKNTACDSPKKKKNPEKCFSSSPRSCWLTGGYSIHQRSAQQSPSFSCEGGRRCARQASSTQGGHHFRFSRGSFYFASRAEIAKVAALILKKRFGII